MSTVAQNNIRTGALHPEGFLYHGHVPVNDSVSHINQGDLVYWDSASHTAKALDTDGHAATLLGVALGSSIVNSNVDNSTSSSLVPNINIGYGVISQFNTTSGDTLHEGDAVYAGADAQTVTSASGNSNKVGVVRLPPRGSNISGGTGVTVPVLVYSQAFVAFKA